MAEGRKPRSVRLTDDEADEVARVAHRDGLSWNEAARRVLAYGASRMPEGWHPGKEARETWRR